MRGRVEGGVGEGRGGEGRGGEERGRGRGRERGRRRLEHLQVTTSEETFLDSESPDDKDF